MYVSSIELNIPNAVSVEFALVQRAEEAAGLIDGRESEAVLGEERSTVGFEVGATACLEHAHT
jgi:hypothetical protein